METGERMFSSKQNCIYTVKEVIALQGVPPSGFVYLVYRHVVGLRQGMDRRKASTHTPTP